VLGNDSILTGNTYELWLIKSITSFAQGDEMENRKR
jgi:hypothetical protein